MTTLDGFAPANAVAPAAPVTLDRAVPLRLLREFGPDPLRRLLAIFGAESQRLAAVASIAVAEGDVDDARRAAHTLKSSAANVGAFALAAVCAELEAMAAAGSLDGAEVLVRRINVGLHEASQELSALAVG